VSISTRAQLKHLLLQRYAAFRRKLEPMAGSRDVAGDALQDTWLRLETMSEVGPLANPDAYLMRMATNAVIDQHRREVRHLHEEEIEALLDVPDELADPERIVAARREVAALEEAMRDMPARRKAILVAARIEGLLTTEIAERFGLSRRMIERELNAALKYCNERLLQMQADDGQTTHRAGKS
jgi:RNA polymerase sigma factor (sigma-70 family)